ncbi:MAG: 16S rRNA (cytosine(1402)-N(4))-methyltransferase RsmH [Desulfovibrionaceae bacterium]|nr:16S rRNA (cytosine(1402)-N(4))-methyltransferase RsmH [Desulfovibrionaceae bacterium]
MNSGRPRHIPVLRDEVLEAFAPLFAPDGTGSARFLDGTLGFGGHSHALLSAHPDLRLLGLDRDSEALALAGERLAGFGDRFSSMHCRFSRFAEALDLAGWDRVDGALIDIGVSSMQLDEGERGFSVHADGPLDMRMDNSSGAPSARELVNTADFRRLRDIIATFGEDPQAARIAKHIVQARERAPITTTGQLAAIVQNAYPPAWRAKARHHPATRTFQALRMVVNDELGELEAFMEGILARLNVGGRLCVITFHSLEDRMVKQIMRRWSQACLCPPHVPVCRCGHLAEVRLVTRKPLTASAAELAANPRAASAKLRCCEKLRDWHAPAEEGAKWT